VLKACALRFGFVLQFYIKKFFWLLGGRIPLIKRMYTHTYPAIHMKMDRWFYIFNFSSELLVLMLVLAVAGFNFYLFTWQPQSFHDGSLAVKFLSNHTSLNPQLYAQSTAIRTVVIRPTFVPEAYAEDLSSLMQDGNGTETEEDELTFVINDNTIIKPNPISVQQLLDKQVKVHTVADGESLRSIASHYHLDSDTILWANKLKNADIKAGWQLLIPPVKGVMVKADTNTTLPDLEKRYGVSMERIIAYNGLADAEDVEDGQFIIVPGGKVTAPPAPKKKAPSRFNYPGKILEGGHIFPKGYCTYYVATRMFVPWGGHAKYWPQNAVAHGAVLVKNPQVGDIYVGKENKRYGHVAYVEEVFGDGSFTIAEMNQAELGRITRRHLPGNYKHLTTFIRFR
jgi:peptidoglycan DL-endopeptidase LytE